MKSYKFSDEVIAQIAKLIQIAIITGTDVVDNLRMISVTESDDNFLTLTDEYRELAENQIQKLLEEMKSIHDKEE